MTTLALRPYSFSNFGMTHTGAWVGAGLRLGSRKNPGAASFSQIRPELAALAGRKSTASPTVESVTHPSQTLGLFGPEDSMIGASLMVGTSEAEVVASSGGGDGQGTVQGGGGSQRGGPSRPGKISKWLKRIGWGVGALVLGAIVYEGIWDLSKDDSERWRVMDNGQERTLKVNDATHGDYVTTHINGQDVKIHYFEKGNPIKPTLLLIPGFGSNAYQYNYIFDELAEHYHVITVDLPGHGYSDNLPAQYTNENDEGYKKVFKAAVIPALEQFMAQKGLTDVTLMGSSMGGGVAQDLAASSARVKQIIIVGSIGSAGEIQEFPWFGTAAAELPIDWVNTSLERTL